MQRPTDAELARIDQALIAAWRDGNHASSARIFFSAATLWQEAGDPDAAAYFFTQSYIFALDAGLADLAETANRTLVRLGREKAA